MLGLEEHESVWIPTSEFSKLYNVPPRTLTNHINHERIKSYRVGDGGKYYLHIKNAYIELKNISKIKYGIEAQSALNKGYSEDRELTLLDNRRAHSKEDTKADTAKIKNEILRMELEQRRNRLISRDAVDSIETEYISRLKSIIQQTPSQLARLTGVDEKLFEDVINSAIEQFNGSLEAKKKMYQDLETRNSLRHY